MGKTDFNYFFTFSPDRKYIFLLYNFQVKFISSLLDLHFPCCLLDGKLQSLIKYEYINCAHVNSTSHFIYILTKKKTHKTHKSQL